MTRKAAMPPGTAAPLPEIRRVFVEVGVRDGDQATAVAIAPSGSRST